MVAYTLSLPPASKIIKYSKPLQRQIGLRDSLTADSNNYSKPVIPYSGCATK